MIEEKNDDQSKTPKKPLIYYAGIAMIIIILLNIFLFPSLLHKQVTEIPYNEFLDMIDAGQVNEVAYDAEAGEIIFVSGTDPRTAKLYSTGIWPDDGQRLLSQLRDNSDIVFSAAIPTQQDPLISFIVSWVLSFAFFLIIGEILKRMMLKKL